jgi:hypothetical protein
VPSVEVVANFTEGLLRFILYRMNYANYMCYNSVDLLFFISFFFIRFIVVSYLLYAFCLVADTEGVT